MDNLSKLLGDSVLPPELMQSLQEAFDKRVQDARTEAEMTVREEFARRYEHDKENLVEAMDRMLTDVVNKHAAEKAEAVKRFEEARRAFRKAVRENRRLAKRKIAESVDRTKTFVIERMSTEVKALREQKKVLLAEKLRVAEQIDKMKRVLLAEQGKRIKKIDEFVVRQVSKELREFSDDHRALVETRVKLVAEARKKLRETQSRFVKQAAGKVEQVINQRLVREMKQLHEDLERNRQNMFGRRIFEAFAAEYLTSYLAEGTEIRKLQQVVEAKQTELTETKGKLLETAKTAQAVVRKVRLAEDRAVRSKVMSELLSNLRGEKRAVMEGMLETVKTDALRATFTKLLPVVIDETTRRNAAGSGRKPLLEPGRTPRPATMVTGDHRSSRLYEAAQAETNDFDNDIAQVLRLAGRK